MKTLEQEAVKYANGITKNQTYKSYLVNAVKFGANSKWVQAEKIKAQIEILYEFRDYAENSEMFNGRIYILQQQLKQLEDEN